MFEPLPWWKQSTPSSLYPISAPFLSLLLLHNMASWGFHPQYVILLCGSAKLRYYQHPWG